jgi:hypothetical protein
MDGRTAAGRSAGESRTNAISASGAPADPPMAITSRPSQTGVGLLAFGTSSDVASRFYEDVASIWVAPVIVTGARSRRERFNQAAVTGVTAGGRLTAKRQVSCSAMNHPGRLQHPTRRRRPTAAVDSPHGTGCACTRARMGTLAPFRQRSTARITVMPASPDVLLAAGRFSRTGERRKPR